MPGSWPTLRDFPHEVGCVNVGSSVGGTTSGLCQTHGRGRKTYGSMGRMCRGQLTIAGGGCEEDVESARRGVLYTFRRAALKGMFDNCDCRAGRVGVENGEPGIEDNTVVGERGVVGQQSSCSVSDTVDGASDGQATPDSIEDIDMALPPFPNLVNKAGKTDWAKYLLWMEDDMSFEERTNNNMLLAGNSIREVTSDEVIQHLSLDIEPTGKRRIMLFKDLPAMRQGQHDGLAMYILGYDAAERVFFVRRFERLSSKIELLPRYWECGKEMVWLSVGRLLQILRDVNLGDASTSNASVLPEWDEELGFKVVVVAMFTQWALDFSSGFRMMEEVAEITQMLLLRWRNSVLTALAGARSSVHELEQSSGGYDRSGTQAVGELNTPPESPLCEDCSELSRASGIGENERSGHASWLIATAPHDGKATTYDSDEEEEWAALQEWAASNKLENPLETINTKPPAGAVTSKAELSPDKPLRPSSTFQSPERGKSPVDMSDLTKPVGAKGFSDSSTLCGEGEETKERLAFANAIRNAMLKEGSIEAMLKVYLEFVKEHPEHDSEKKRSDLFDFLVAHIGEQDSGSRSVTDTLQVLKKMGLAEENEADVAEA